MDARNKEYLKVPKGEYHMVPPSHVLSQITSMMRKYLYFYLIAFMLLVFGLLFFFKVYNELLSYIEKNARANRVHNSFQVISTQINNAAIISPDVLEAVDKSYQHIFYTDSQSVVDELENLKNAVSDSVNIRISARLDTLIRAELSWLIQSNVIDSMLNKRAREHILVLQNINALTRQGIQRTYFLVNYRKDKLDTVLKRDGIAMLVFILLAGALLISTSVKLFNQKAKRKDKEEELSKKEHQFSRTLDGLLEGVQIHDFNWTYIYANATLERYSMGSKGELLGHTLMEKYPGIERTELFEVLRECMIKRTSKQFETEFVFPDGRKADFELSAHPVPEGLFILSIDITERKKTEAQLLLNEARYRSVVENIHESLIVEDAEGKLLYANNEFREMFGYDPHEIAGLSLQDYTSPTSYNEVLDRHNRRMKGQSVSEEFEYLGKKKDGTEIWIEARVSPIMKDGKIIGTQSLEKDITVRKKSEEELKKSEKRYRQTLDNMLEGVQILDFNWTYIYVNNALVKHSMYSRKDLMGSVFMERYPGVEETELFDVMKKCMNKRMEAHLENEFVYPDGSKAFFELSIQPVPEGIFILSIDITERKKTEEKLKKVNRLYAFISAINQTIVHVNTKEKLIVNACAVAVDIGKFKTAWIGWLTEDGKIDMAEVCGEHPTTENGHKHIGLDYNSDLLKNTPTGKALQTGLFAVCNDVETDPSMGPWREQFRENGLRSNSTFPIKMFGKVVGVFAFTSGIRNFFDKEEVSLLQEAVGDISFALEIIHNAKKHDETEKLVLRNERRFRALIEKSIDVKTLTSREGIFIYCSQSIKKILGYDEEEFLNRSCREFFHPDEVDDLIKRREQLLHSPGESFNFCYRILHKNGSWRWCEGTLTNMFHEPAIGAFVANFSDITEKKLIEEEREKMSTDIILRNKHLEQFAYIISHNLRGPVANILGISNLLKTTSTEKEREQLQNFLFGAVEKLDLTVIDLNKILELRSSIDAQWEPVIFSDLVGDIKASIHNYIEQEKVLILTDFSAINQVTSVRSYVHSIFYNLISNSIKYKKAGEPVTIYIASAIEKGKVKLFFKDNGIGIDMKLHGAKIFKLYQRFHQRVEGKGMGLFMVKSQVETLGGTVEIVSEPGMGTEFIIELPLKAY